jgi:hypothetical protein
MTRNGHSRSAKLNYGQPTFQSADHAVGFGAEAKAQHLHGGTNPFSIEADGSKIPDSNTSKTQGIQLKQSYPMTSLASGELYHQFSANLMDMHQYATAFTGNAVSAWSAAQDSDYVTSLNAQYSRYRVVSWGIRIFTVLAPTEQSGSLIFQTADEIIAAPDHGSYLFEEAKSFAVDDLEVVFIGSETDEVRRNYRLIDAAGTGAGARDIGMNFLYVGGTGLPASKQCFTAEVVMNIELQPLALTTGSLMASPAAHHDPIGMAAIANTHVSLPSFHTGGLKAIGARIAKTLGSRLMDLVETRIPGVGMLRDAFGRPLSNTRRTKGRLMIKEVN